MKRDLEFHSENKELLLTDIVLASAFTCLGQELKEIRRTENGIYYVFDETVDSINTMTMYNKMLSFLMSEKDKYKATEKYKEITSKDPFFTKEVFQESKNKIKGAAKKGSNGKWS